MKPRTLQALACLRGCFNAAGESPAVWLIVMTWQGRSRYPQHLAGSDALATISATVIEVEIHNGRGEPGYAQHLAQLSVRASCSGEAGGSSRPSTSGGSRASACGD